MKKILALCFSIMLAVFATGCASSSSTATSSVSAQASHDTLTELEIAEIDGFLESDQMVALSDAINKSFDGLPDVVASGDVKEIDKRFLDLAIALQDAEDMKVPESCAVLHDKKIQVARCLVVALGKYSDVAEKGFASAKKESDEGSQYLRLANQYYEEYNEEYNRLVDLM